MEIAFVTGEVEGAGEVVEAPPAAEKQTLFQGIIILSLFLSRYTV